MYGKGNFGFLAARSLREAAPFGFGVEYPFAFGIDDEGLLMLGAQCAGHRGTAYQLVVGRNTLEIAPAGGYLILPYCRFGNFDSEIIFGNAVESAVLHIGRYFALADYFAHAKAALECTAVFIVRGFVADTFERFG